MITRNNYEVYFIDYFDGKLSDGEVEELLRFLSNNSDLEEEFYALLEQSDNMAISGADFTFETVKRDERFGYDLTTFDYLCIADVENEIGNDEKKLLSQSVNANSKLKHDLELYHKTKVPTEAVIFPNKEQLKKNIFLKKRTRKVLTYSSIAAAVTIVMILALPNKEELQLAPKEQASDISTFTQPTNVHVKAAYSKQTISINEPVVVKDDSNYATHGANKAITKQQNHNVNEQFAIKKQDTIPAYLASHIKIVVENTSAVALDVKSISSNPEPTEPNLFAAVSDNEIVNSVNSFIAKAKNETQEVAHSIKEIKGRKRGVFFARIVNSVNTVLGTNMQYSSTYTADGELVAVSFDAGKLNISKKNDEIE